MINREEEQKTWQEKRVQEGESGKKTLLAIMSITVRYFIIYSFLEVINNDVVKDLKREENK